MDAKTRKLLVDADSYLSLLWHRYVPGKHRHGTLKLEVESVIARLRKAQQELQNTMEVHTR